MTNPDREELVKLADLRSANVAWQGMDTAPKGYPTEDAGCRGPSEWFIGHPSKKYRSASPMVVIRRRAWPQDDHWEDNGETYYRPDYFDGWRSLSLYTAPPADAGMREVLREAYTAGALAVHNEWLAATERGEGPPRGEPDFSEAASDYASLTAPGATTKSDGGGGSRPAFEEERIEATTVHEDRTTSLAAVRQMAGVASGPSDLSSTYTIAHDGFTGTVQGHYVTREGKQGVVLQQVGTRVVHVYGRKWIDGGTTSDPSSTRSDVTPNERFAPRMLVIDAMHAVCVGGRWDGWKFYKHPDGQWVSLEKLNEVRP